MTKKKRGTDTTSDDGSTFLEKVTKLDAILDIAVEQIRKVRGSFKIGRENEGTEYDVTQAQEMVKGWCLVNGRTHTKSECECLVSAILAGVSDPNHFDSVLFGYSIRGEQNLVEERNILNAMQELINGMLAEQKDLLDKFNKVLQQIQAALVFL
ncbi:hypothetical protein VNO80_27711 [Phaseolus coccineus]|uniref:Uncharacterized protein n=1 Tax=Phaseolus coccineus TaxID=3886 RepID=A0AAN9QLG6_PHACN